VASKNLPRNSKKRRPPWVRFLKQGLVLFATLIFLGISVLGFFYFNARRDAEDAMNDLQKRIDSVNKPTSKILSRDGVVLFSVSTENRIPLKLSQIPKFVQNAVIAAEDRRFYKHTGVDLTSIARVIFVDMRGRKLSQGGSTITMQLVKLLFNGSSKTFKRKMNDIAYAQVMEQRLTKERILELYLNKVFFGEGAFGIGEAARVYFNKNIEDLTIGEAAMLARCIRRPSYENPIRDLEAATTNRDVVLGTMRDEAMITDEQYEKAVAEKPKVNTKPPTSGVFKKPGAEYFVDHVLQYLEKDQGLDLLNSGLTIETTLDFDLQRHTQQVLRNFVDEFGRHLKVNQGAFMVMDSDGNILAEVGGLNYRQHQQNIVTSGTLQPGSGFKPFVYATALKAGIINMDSMLSNAPISIVDPVTGKLIKSFRNASRNENHPFYGLRTALASSINLCAIHTIEAVGPQSVVDTAKDSFGFRSKLDAYDSLALGACSVAPIEMAEAYSVFMLHGDRVVPQPIVRVVANDGSIIKQYEPHKIVGAYDTAVSDEVDELLRGVVEYGTGYEARIVPNARGKTGTTNEAKDAWFTGYADGVLGVGWVGHEVKKNGIWTPVEMNTEVYGGNTSAKIWGQVMKLAHERYGKAQASHDAKPDKPKAIDQAAGAGVDPDLMAGPGDAKQDPAKNGDGDDGTIVLTGDADKTEPIKPGDDKVGAGKPIAPDATGAKPPKPKPAVKPEDDTISVDICQDSGLIANRYCPETVTRTFKRGREPKRICHIHGPGG